MIANRRILEIGEVQHVPHVPWSHPVVERLIPDDAASVPWMHWDRSGMRVILATEARRLPGLLQHGTQPHVVGPLTRR